MPFFTATTIVQHGGDSKLMSETALSREDARRHLELSIRMKFRDDVLDVSRQCMPWPPVIAIDADR